MRTVIQNANGTRTVVAVEDGNLITGTVQDCTAIAERAKAMHNAGHVGSSEMRLAATLPDVMVEHYCNTKGITFAEFMRDKAHIRYMLNDPALAHFRVWKGKV
jgi:phosphosulfolactate phosphohydrolase-like enzyme